MIDCHQIDSRPCKEPFELHRHIWPLSEVKLPLANLLRCSACRPKRPLALLSVNVRNAGET